MADPGLTVVSDASAGMVGQSSSDVGVYGTSVNSDGVSGYTQAKGRAGIFGAAAGVFGLSEKGSGVQGISAATAGVAGISFSTSSGSVGVLGSAEKIGVFGGAIGGETPEHLVPTTFGVVGRSSGGCGVLGSTVGAPNPSDRPSAISAGVLGTSVNGQGVVAQTQQGAAAFIAFGPGRNEVHIAAPQGVMQASGAFAGYLSVDGNLYVKNDVEIDGDLIAIGKNKHSAVPHPDGSHRLLYCMESPEAWFEDFGRARLVRGKARIRLDRTFAAVVRTGDYHVFLSPEGNCGGLFVSRRSRNGFEVGELGRGTSTLPFSYRIVARRKDVAAPRFKIFKPTQFKSMRMRSGKLALPDLPARPRRPRPPAFVVRAGSRK